MGKRDKRKKRKNRMKKHLESSGHNAPDSKPKTQLPPPPQPQKPNTVHVSSGK